jgi:K+-transporting ATPase KdpF subunit
VANERGGRRQGAKRASPREFAEADGTARERLRRLGGRAMSALYVVGGIVAAALFVYLVAAMLKPEWFE